jgi:2,3-bisphosphoglycerate-dependent phosphoglycerate mutase
MQLYLIRHAESENNAKPPQERVEDPPITEVGRMQAALLADWLRTLPIDVLITSPVLRALQTTRHISETTSQHVHVWADVFEEGGIYRGYGPEAIQGGPGLKRSDVIRHATQEPSNCTLDETISESGWWGGRNRETAEEATRRAIAVAARFMDSFGASGRNIVAVIHADFKRKLLAQLIGGQIDPRAFGALRNTGITKLNYDGSQWQLDWFNSVTHLPAKLITGIET